MKIVIQSGKSGSCPVEIWGNDGNEVSLITTIPYGVPIHMEQEPRRTEIWGYGPKPFSYGILSPIGSSSV